MDPWPQAPIVLNSLSPQSPKPQTLNLQDTPQLKDAVLFVIDASSKDVADAGVVRGNFV